MQIVLTIYIGKKYAADSVFILKKDHAVTDTL